MDGILHCGWSRTTLECEPGSVDGFTAVAPTILFVHSSVHIPHIGVSGGLYLAVLCLVGACALRLRCGSSPQCKIADVGIWRGLGEPMPMRKACVMVVDDDPAITDLLQIALEDAGYEGLIAIHG